MALKGGGCIAIVLIFFIIPVYCQATGGWNRAVPEQGAEEKDSDDLQIVAPFQRAGSPS